MRFSIFDSLRIGWESAKTNRLPMAVLWTIAAILAVSYYCVPPVARALVPLADWQTKWGPLAGAANQMFFCGVVPGLFMLVAKSIRPDRALPKIALHRLEHLAQIAPFLPNSALVYIRPVLFTQLRAKPLKIAVIRRLPQIENRACYYKLGHKNIVAVPIRLSQFIHKAVRVKGKLSEAFGYLIILILSEVWNGRERILAA